LSRSSAKRHRLGRGERLPARRLGLAVDPEQRHDAVAQEHVDPAARGLDRLAHRLKNWLSTPSRTAGKRGRIRPARRAPALRR
jgi:hypothetical protein